MKAPSATTVAEGPFPAFLDPFQGPDWDIPMTTKDHLLGSTSATPPARTSEEILKADFLKFLWFVFTRVLSLPPPTPLQFDIARFLADGDAHPLRFIQAFRGVGKSFLTCCYVVWRLWKQPNLKVMIVSANETLATENATLIQMIIEHEAGDDLWGALRGGRRSSTLAFDVGGCVPDKSPSVKVVGITGQLTGSRSDILISDDVEVPKNSQTEAQRDKLRELTGEYTDIAKTGSEIIYLGTPQSMESIYKALPGKGYKVRIWTGRFPLAAKLKNYADTLAPMLLAAIKASPDLCKPIGSSLGGAPTDTRFTEIELQKKEVGRGAAGFMLQYMLDTELADADRYPLKTRDLIVMDVSVKMAPVRVAWSSAPETAWKDLSNVGFDGDRCHRPFYTSPEFADFTGSVMIVDPSGRGRDETAYCVTKFLNGQVYVRRWGGFREGYSAETLQALADIAGEEEVNLIKCEDTFGDGMFRQLLEPYVTRRYPAPMEGYKRFTQKEVRIIDVLRPTMAQHRVVMDAAVVRRDLAEKDNVRRGLYQLTHLTTQKGSLKHDDRIEVLAEGVLAWAERLNADANKAEEAHRQRAEREWEKQFFAGTIIGGVALPSKPSTRAVGRRVTGSLPQGILKRKIRW